MSLATEVFTAWKEGFDNKDSTRCAEFLTDDFEIVSPIGVTRSRQQTLDWIAGGGNQASIDDLEVLYETDAVAVITHSTKSNNPQTLRQVGQVMTYGRKRDGKLCYVRVTTAVISS